MMDQYILMCREAKEIQEAWKPKRGDVAFAYGHERMIWTGNLKDEHVTIVNGMLHDYTGWPEYKKLDCAWLPRIEDLINMLVSRFAPAIPKPKMKPNFLVWIMTQKFNEFIDQVPFAYSHQEVWLCFVMHTLHKKSWNNDTWESAETIN